MPRLDAGSPHACADEACMCPGSRVPIGSLLLGLGTRYKINDNVNGFIETRVDYTDGRPFSVPHRLVEITTLLGIEFGL